MNRMSLTILLLIAVFSHAGVFNDDFSSSGYSEGGGEYLKPAVHAQTAGLEAATVAWRDGLAGLQYNPAILDAADSITLAGTNTFLTCNRRHFGIDAVIPFGLWLVSGVSFVQYGVNDIEGRDDYGGLTGSFNSSFNAVSAAVAGRLTIPVSLGIRGRCIFETIQKEHSTGVGFDLGATWQPLPRFCVGASLQNVGSYVWWSTNRRDRVLTTGRLGACGLFLDKMLRVEIDLQKTLDQPEEAALGAEYGFLGLFRVRAGIREALITQTRAVMNPEYSLGAGMRYDFLGFDYALVVPPSSLGVVHKISVSGRIAVWE